MTQEELFYSIFENIPRQGPGTKASTLKAFSAIKTLPQDAQILDIGCGKGVQTFDLAEIINRDPIFRKDRIPVPNITITAIDNHPFFIEFLNTKATKLGLNNRVKGMEGDMNNLPFAENQFNLIWAEGSIFITGFENGLKNWAKFLKYDGYMVVSEAAWFHNNPPDEIKEFWNAVYPDIISMEEQQKLIETCGYRIIDSFQLPKEGWLDEYYAFMEPLLESARNEYGNEPELAGLLNVLQTEIDMYKKYGDYYGYAFYVMKKK
ncbi:MAG: class I SAM-dependent methyltransferase [Prolixibacteraceae bacterium]|jgi:ubiquinone/menaquinone biosynthesis C-methylase UbiE|nr:class I SAM-dependent methyltransferase [Prolixibacteraceae bacterium]